ncbi:MAG: DsbA family oxidoreductase [Azospirillum sp.]|nr:DsbA family oxidoreductase [Azospirillum sp.]
MVCHSADDQLSGVKTLTLDGGADYDQVGRGRCGPGSSGTRLALTNPPRPVRLDIISDVVCPWCVLGYRQVATAAAALDCPLDVAWHPFELNPEMPPEGQSLFEHVEQKYGATREQSRKARQRIAALGAELGFTFAFGDDMRIWNSFRAHQLLFWARPTGAQTALKLALFTSGFTEGKNLDDPAVLLDAVAQVGLDRAAAATVLADQRHAADVRKAEQVWHTQGIQGVPAMVFEGSFLVMGARDVETFQQLLKTLIEAPRER